MREQNDWLILSYQTLDELHFQQESAVSMVFQRISDEVKRVYLFFETKLIIIPKDGKDTLPGSQRSQG